MNVRCPVESSEYTPLVTGRGCFADDRGERPGTAHAAVLRSPHAHAEIVGIDATAAHSMPEVVAVLTGEDVAAWTRPFIAGVKQPMRHYALAVDRVRYVGEPVAVVVARNRYAAEDALDRIEVEYREIEPVIDPVAAAAAAAVPAPATPAASVAPLLHPEVGSNVVSDRHFRYGDPETTFATAGHRIGISVRYPRNACTPIEGFVVVAEYLGEDGYDVFSNFQGPFSLHPVMARALGVPGSRLRLRSPRDSGGSFGVKQAIFPWVVAMCLASRKAGCPVKWVEDRIEHLVASTSATNRVTTVEAAVTDDGTVTALRWDQLDDCGAYLRAPEPASLYRTHGHMTGPYRIPNLEIRNRVVLTNKTPTGLNRGFGGPQVYFALERLMHRIANTLGLDPLDVIRRNLVPKEAFPYRAASGSLLDSGDYATALDIATGDGRLARLRVRRDAARAEGRRYGIGFAAVVEPSISNMGYITMALTPKERGAGRTQGRGRGVRHRRHRPHRLGHRAGRFRPPGPGTPHRARPGRRRRAGGGVRGRYRERGARHPEGPLVDRGRELLQPLLGRGRGRRAPRGDEASRPSRTHREHPTQRPARGARVRGWPDRRGRQPRERGPAATRCRYRPLVSRLAPRAHRAGPARDRLLVDARARSAGRRRPGEQLRRLRLHLRHVRVEVDDTGRVRIDEYVTMHDAGRRLNPALVDGQIRGGFAHGLGAALYEELAYSDDGSFLSGTFADYLVPTACEVPNPTILHMETPLAVHPARGEGGRRRQYHEHSGLPRERGGRRARHRRRGAADDPVEGRVLVRRRWFAGEEPPPE